MTETENEQLRRWAENWEVVGRRLEELRRKELPLVDTQRALLNLADAYEACRLQGRIRPTSGLVQQQAFFRLLRQCELAELKKLQGRS
jgi:hypothetical protein